MKKRLIILFVFIIMLCIITGCDSVEIRTLKTNISSVNSKYMSLQTIEEGDSYIVFRDINTNVLYIFAGRADNGVLTPILNSDGTPKLYKEN